MLYSVLLSFVLLHGATIGLGNAQADGPEMSAIHRYIESHLAQPHFADAHSKCKLSKFVLYEPRFKRPNPHDLQQGVIGNCFLVQTLTAIAIADPEILMRNIGIDDLESGHFTVRFYDFTLRKHVGVAVNLEIPTCLTRVNLRVDDTGHFIVWPFVYEKAFAKYLDWKAKTDPEEAKFISENIHAGQGYERMMKGGSSGVVMYILTGTPVILHDIFGEPAMKTLWLLARYAKGLDNAANSNYADRTGYQRTAPRRRPIIISTPSESVADIVSRSITDAQVRSNLFGCFLHQHAHPLYDFDYKLGKVYLWCGKNGGFTVMMPWLQFARSRPKLYVPWNSTFDAYPSEKSMSKLMQSILTDPIVQPPLLTVGRWIDVVSGEDDFTRLPAPTEVSGTNLETVLRVAFEICADHCIKNRIKRTDDTSYEVTLSIDHDSVVKVMVDRKIQAEMPLFPFPENTFYRFHTDVDPQTVWALSFQKALSKLVAFDGQRRFLTAFLYPDLMSIKKLFELIKPPDLIVEEIDLNQMTKFRRGVLAIFLTVLESSIASSCGWKPGMVVRGRLIKRFLVVDQVSVPCQMNDRNIKVHDLAQLYRSSVTVISHSQ